ncbi:unnamed protein product [Schistosoma bovis]|nr:unnamed protein product [Schistosoma bovis]
MSFRNTSYFIFNLEFTIPFVKSKHNLEVFSKILITLFHVSLQLYFHIHISITLTTNIIDQCDLSTNVNHSIISANPLSSLVERIEIYFEEIFTNENSKWKV